MSKVLNYKNNDEILSSKTLVPNPDMKNVIASVAKQSRPLSSDCHEPFGLSQ